MITRALMVGVVCGVAMSACHRLYEIRGTVQVVPSAVRKAILPSVLCSGHGGSLETSAVYAHPAERSHEGNAHPTAVVFCAEPQVGESVPRRESIYYGSLPRQAHVYAWLAPIPVAQSLCAKSGTDIVEVNREALYALKLLAQADTPRADPTWPCGFKPPKGAPMTFAITFNPEHKTWDESEGAQWIETRVLRIE